MSRNKKIKSIKFVDLNIGPLQIEAIFTDDDGMDVPEVVGEADLDGIDPDSIDESFIQGLVGSSIDMARLAIRTHDWMAKAAPSKVADPPADRLALVRILGSGRPGEMADRFIGRSLGANEYGRFSFDRVQDIACGWSLTDDIAAVANGWTTDLTDVNKLMPVLPANVVVSFPSSAIVIFDWPHGPLPVDK